MKYILALVVLIYPIVTKSMPIYWESSAKIDNIEIKSQYSLSTDKIYKIYKRSKQLFINNFEPKLNCNFTDKLFIYIISANLLRNKKYFVDASYTNFGRYFYKNNTIYVIDSVTNNPEFLAHELAHHFYKTCKKQFITKKYEHIRVYKFQDLYNKIYSNE